MYLMVSSSLSLRLAVAEDSSPLVFPEPTIRRILLGLRPCRGRGLPWAMMESSHDVRMYPVALQVVSSHVDVNVLSRSTSRELRGGRCATPSHSQCSWQTCESSKQTPFTTTSIPHFVRSPEHRVQTKWPRPHLAMWIVCLNHLTTQGMTNIDTAQLRAIISNLYMLIVQAHDYQGAGTQQAMQAEMYSLLVPSPCNFAVTTCLTPLIANAS